MIHSSLPLGRQTGGLQKPIFSWMGNRIKSGTDLLFFFYNDKINQQETF